MKWAAGEAAAQCTALIGKLHQSAAADLTIT
jgi:hypothetical protein